MGAPPRGTRLLLIRHGLHDPRGRFVQHACEGLTDAGVLQARALATRLARDPTVTAPVVLASMARRASDTAEIVAATLGVPLAERTCDLCEMHPGAAEGLTQQEMAERYGPNYAFVPGAEAFPEWVPRAGAALDRIAAAYPGRQILALTHGGVIRASFVAFGGLPLAKTPLIQTANTGITEWSSTLETEWEKVGPWRLDRHNDTAHL